MFTKLFPLFIFITLVIGCSSASNSPTQEKTPSSAGAPSSTLTLEKLQADTFKYFWETTDKSTGLAPDRYPTEGPASIATVGFALTAYPIGVEQQYISREQAIAQTLKTLRFIKSLPHGPAESGTAGYQGFFYHFLDDKGLRYTDWDVELSTVDTALFIAGALFAQSYFDRDTSDEIEIRQLADDIYHAINWQWAQSNYPLVSLGWYPDNRGFINYDWVGYNEAMILYILALGSPTFPVEPNAWQGWVNHYQDDWGGSGEFTHLTFAPLFGHQYSHIWIDFRGIQDGYMREKNSDYFKNSRTAVYAQRQYATANPNGWKDYSDLIWGLTACDGPGNFKRIYKGSMREFRAYSARGVALNHSFDDGTIAPTAAVASLPFAPEIVIPTIQALHARYGQHLYGEYGFLDAINPSFTFDVTPSNGKIVPGVGWVGTDYIGIDQGPILAMAENFRSELIWKTMQKNKYIRRGLERAGFTGGWLKD